MPDVVVSIVNMNGRAHVLDCLASLSRPSDHLEIVVLDNASDDGSVAAIRESFPRVRIIEQHFRSGFGANHNTILRATRSSYVVMLNPDTRVPAGAIEHLVGYMESRPNVAVVGPLIRDFDGRQQGSAWRLMSVWVQLTWALTLGQRGAVVSRGADPKPVDAVTAAAAVYRREALESVGAFDESYFMFGEEGDLARRLRDLGFETHYVPTAEIHHEGQQSTAHLPEHQINEVWRSLDVYLARYHSPVSARVMRWLTGVGYGLAFVAAQVGRRLPPRLRPDATDVWTPNIYRLHVRNAFLGNRDPGLSDLAEEWNREHRSIPHRQETKASGQPF